MTSSYSVVHRDGLRPCRYAWIAVEDPTLLDYQNAEMVFMAERSDDARALSGRKMPVCTPVPSAWLICTLSKNFKMVSCALRGSRPHA